MANPPSDPGLIGRERLVLNALAALAAAVRETTPAVLYLWGPSGIGKSGLLTEVLRQHRKRQASVVCFHLFKDQPASGELLLTEPLSLTVEASPAIVEATTLWRRSHQRQLTAAALPREGGGVAVDTPSDILPWAELIGILPAQARLLLVIDDLDDWTARERKALEIQVIRPLLESPFANRLDALYAGRPPDACDRHFEEAWSQHARHLHKISLPPLSDEEARRLIFNLSPDFQDTAHILSQSEGNPGRIRELMAGEVQRRHGLQNQALLEAVMKSIKPRERRLIAAAAHLDQVCSDGLAAVLQENVDSAEADFIRFHLATYFTTYAGQAQVPPEVRVAIMEWAREAKVFAPDAAVADRINRFNQVIRAISNERVRRQLRWFVPFRFFNRDLLHKVYAREAVELLAFVQENPMLFEDTGTNTQVAPAFQFAVAEYARLVQFSPDTIVAHRLTEIWQTRKEQLESEKGEALAIVQGHEKLLNQVDKDIETLSSKLAVSQDRLQQLASVEARRRPAPQRPASTGLRGLRGIFAEVAGVVLLYIGILFGDGMNLLYVMAGLALVGAGILGTFRGSPKNRDQAPTSRARSRVPAPLTREGHTFRLLEMRLNSLRFRRSDLAIKLKQATLTYDRADHLLAEPYLAESSP